MNQMSNQQVRNAYELLRAPDRQPKCYDMTEQERAVAVTRLSQQNWYTKFAQSRNENQ